MVLSYNLTLAEVLQRASVFLQEQGMDDAPVKNYWSQVFDLSYTQLILSLQQKVSNQEIDRFNEVLLRLANHEPIQYIVGMADFVGNAYKVTSDTLIPREDTYGLIEMAHAYIAKYPQSTVVDIGTGSGIIAIEIAKANPQATVLAVDLSKAALQVASENADTHQVKIDFFESDLLNVFTPQHQFDLIISNPPYIAEDELVLMDESVKRYEPSLALFAENHGLAIYQKIAAKATDYLSNRGQLLLEIGFKQGEAVKAIFEEAMPEFQVTIHQDLNQLDRYIKVKRKEAD